MQNSVPIDAFNPVIAMTKTSYTRRIPDHPALKDDKYPKFQVLLSACIIVLSEAINETRKSQVSSPGARGMTE